MPEEIMIIAVVAIVFGTVAGMVKNVLSYKAKQMETERSNSMASNSLGTSELETMIAAAVAQAMGPVEDELRKLRRQNRRAEASALDQDRTKALGMGEPLIDLDDVDSGIVEEEHTAAQRSRA